MVQINSVRLNFIARVHIMMRFFLVLTLFVIANGSRFYEATQNGISGRYIIVLKEGEDLLQISRRFIGDANKLGIPVAIKFRYQALFTGFAAEVDKEGRGLQLLLSLPGIDYVEQDKTIHIDEAVGSWGVDRIDQRDLPLNNDMSLDSYGKGAHIYVIDTGINPDHVDFGGRAFVAKDLVNENGTGIDCNGHGTHCAGTAASNTYGVAREANVYGIRILNCDGSGTVSASVAALDWVGAEGNRPAVASMSIGGLPSPTEEAAVSRAKQLGVVVVVSAGNNYGDACRQSPARSEDAITVGSTDNEDTRSSFSNYGSCVDVFAPGSSITSLSHDSNTGTTVMSGTSMACPHVSGIAAVLLAQGRSTQQVYDKVISSATHGIVKNANGSPNLLAYCS